MIIPDSAIKYGNAVTRINSAGTWSPVKTAWIMQSDGTWAPIKTGWIKHDDGTWQRVLPTPAGIFSANAATIQHRYPQHYPDPGNVVVVTNTGDYDLTINSITVNDNVNFSTFANSLATFPITLTPGQTSTLPFIVGGNTVGTYSGNVVFTNYVGYLGYANSTINTSVTVDPNVNGIALVGANPALTVYQGDDATVQSYSGYTNTSFTVPFGITSMQLNIAGGGGGGGGGDTYAGGRGYPGHTVVATVSVTYGDTIAVYVGGGGGGGASMAAGSGGGTAGASGVSYGGGRGGNAGASPASGSGGGGGAATVIKKNGTVIAVAAGGGGGGGGGDRGGPGGQYIQYTSGTAGTQGQDKSGDGAGAGGGGGGTLGGLGGSVNGGGDVGGHAGSDGSDTVPSGGTVGRANNAGGPGPRPSSGGTGGDGYAYITMTGIASSAAQTVTIQNSGNGSTLNISDIASENGYFLPYNLTSSAIGFNYTTYTGNTAQFTIAPYTSLSTGTYKDNIVITSDASNSPTYKIPVSINVSLASGNQAFTTPGLQTWTVPAHVHSVDLFLVGGGGSGGRGLDTNGGGGGGGGSGAYTQLRSVKVTPGETLTINVGAGGGAGASGSTTTISGSFGTYTIAGGSAGSAATETVDTGGGIWDWWNSGGGGE